LIRGNKNTAPSMDDPVRKSPNQGNEHPGRNTNTKPITTSFVSRSRFVILRVDDRRKGAARAHLIGNRQSGRAAITQHSNPP
jgi:hypothetical protein